MHSLVNFRNSAALISLAALGAVTGPIEAGAQLRPSAGANVIWEGYQFSTPEAADIHRLSLFTIPVSVNFPVTRVVSLRASSSFARGHLSRSDGSSATVTGATDTELRLGFDLGSPRRSMATLSLLALLPTGNSSHSLDEAQVAGAIASELLPFRITHWGTGGGFGASVGALGALGQGSIGASASYLLAREFEPLEFETTSPFVYRPGNQLQLRAALDQNVGPTGKVNLAVTMLHHSDDEQAGTNLYRPGTRYHATGSYAFAAGSRSTALLYVGGLHRDRGTALAEQVIAAPAQNLFLAGAGLRTPTGHGTLAPSLDFRLHRSEDGVGQGFLVGIGSSFECSANGTLLTQSVRLRAGNLIVRDGVESRLLGLELGLSARLGRRP